MRYGIGKYGEGVYGEVSSAITESEILPPDAKQALKDFLKDTFEKLWSSLEDILTLNPPAELLDYWDTFIKIVRSLML